MVVVRSAASMAAAAAVLAGGPPLASASVQPPAGIAATPLHTSGSRPTYPRLVRFPDPQVLARVNTALAAQEKADRNDSAQCYAQVRAQNGKPDADTYSEDVRVSYLSRRFLSVDVVTSYDCGGAYPTNGAEVPVTFDLTRGVPVAWTAMFKPGFLAADGATPSPPSVLTRLYRARYRLGAAKDDECRPVIADEDPFSSSPIFWLDARGGLMVRPDFPHVTAACADALALRAIDVAPYLKDPALAAELSARAGGPR